MLKVQHESWSRKHHPSGHGSHMAGGFGPLAGHGSKSTCNRRTCLGAVCTNLLLSIASRPRQVPTDRNDGRVSSDDKSETVFNTHSGGNKRGTSPNKREQCHWCDAEGKDWETYGNAESGCRCAGHLHSTPVLVLCVVVSRFMNTEDKTLNFNLSGIVRLF